ncbi:16S rRNA (cytidine(1402)-2'-O)-methyltransferase [Bradyrhizobium sp. LHD-71]|uniref:16S rRNA (cytidine(1402)-2'-O)-methyltransferase n=1 Tax=Bradyrhizobium sp. LHD-71 TaxID=3072141 RepID=UPI00281077F0|nr:16S rRNA (cytidine(1402)-2'-O)-methyltransferase [Bradyrhizobium sp. LHD-71]MDQ8732198.1 16S rRNA (cytidine(1402)-2'-O)-methyltransferase [Bradyrhizobium sp. LHD-71]
MRAKPTSQPASLPPNERLRTFTIAGTTVPASRPSPGLYLVATPIGNLGDITLRALETLAGADVIACEDSRVTRRLLDRFLIATPLVPYHEHNAPTARPKLLERLAQGATVALVSDAGTPLISDPGFKLVRDAAAAGHAVTPIPGASALLAALTVAGLPTDRFYFEGFLPPKEGARRARIKDLATIDATLVLFEGGSRIADTLRDLADVMSERQAAVCRELTKLHEDVRRAPLSALAAEADHHETRGEFVIVVGPPDADSQRLSTDEIDDILKEAMKSRSVKDAVAHAVELSGRPRREVYARALDLAKRSSDDEES